MRLLIHSNAPGAPTGYGQQAGIFGPLFAKAGHDVAYSAFWGLHAGVTGYQGMPVYPGGDDDWGMDVLAGHYEDWNADLLITLCDVWPLNTEILGSGMKVACWTPVDCEPLGKADEMVLRKTHALPIALSRHGERMLRQAFFKPWYVPHGIDTRVFAPPQDRDALRASMGLDGKFVVGINAANRDTIDRKSFGDQFAAFARFHEKHPQSVLLVHTVANRFLYGGLNLEALRDDLGLQEAMKFAGQYTIKAQMVSSEALAKWYGALDVLMNCSQGEGFGIPIVEAQACGTPVIVTNAAAMPELCGAGWKVQGQRRWVGYLGSWWKVPDVGEIVTALEHAFRAPGRKREQAREFALGYDAERVMEKYWTPVLEFLEAA